VAAHPKKRIKPGDGAPLPEYRWWQPLSRALFHLRLTDPASGERNVWSVDVKLWGDDDGEVRARLYRDGVQHSVSKLPAAFPVAGGTIEIVASTFGLKRCHFVSATGAEAQLAPDPASAEGRRARLDREHRGLSRGISVASVSILVVALVLGVPQIIEQVSGIPWIAENVGTFVSPIHLPGEVNIGLLIGSVVASTERALRLRYNWLLDGGLFDSGE